MKILMSENDSYEKLNALLAFKKLNIANAIDFVADGAGVINYLNSRIDLNHELPNLIILDFSNLSCTYDTLKSINTNKKLNHIDVIVLSKTKEINEGCLESVQFNYKIDGLENNKSTIFNTICSDLIKKPKWKYSIERFSDLKAA